MDLETQRRKRNLRALLYFVACALVAGLIIYLVLPTELEDVPVTSNHGKIDSSIRDGD